MSHLKKTGEPKSMARLASELPSRTDRAGRLLWLLGPLLILSLSLLLRPGEGREVFLPWGQISLPETCTFYRFFGLGCPGCGLTRCFLHIARGDLRGAAQLNPVGIVLYTYLAMQVPQALLRWASDEDRRRWISDAALNRWTRINEWALIGIMLGLTIQWVIRIVIGENTVDALALLNL